MANIFKQNLDVTEHPNRNNHDLSHKVHGSYKMGVLYPFLCKPVVPNDSFRINTECGFQLMPMPFPTQSNIRCIFHYFYVRNKNIWENWENWLEDLETHTPPFIDQPASFYKTGSLADYLDIPTTFATKTDYSIMYEQTDVKSLNDSAYVAWRTASASSGDILSTKFSVNFSTSYRRFLMLFKPTFQFVEDPAFLQLHVILPYVSGTRNNLAALNSTYSNFRLLFAAGRTSSSADLTELVYRDNVYLEPVSVRNFNYIPAGGTQHEYIDVLFKIPESAYSAYQGVINVFDLNDEQCTLGFLCSCDSQSTATLVDDTPFINNVPETLAAHFYVTKDSEEVIDIENLDSMPYFHTGENNNDRVKLSALPFRAYESIYRAFYANSILQPLEINGQPTYNRYNENLGDGSDTTDYHLFRRNWELDAYTSCLPSPQQGAMPLVGITESGDMRITDPDTGEVSRFHLEQDGDRQTIQVDSVSNPEHAKLAVNLVNSGISIPDFREVNAYQRFKEQAIRSGYKYKDFIKGNFGTSPKFNELDMPEFLGGFTQRVDVNMISNSNGVTPAGSKDVLGSFAGQARAFGRSKHGITHYFDDYGWIIGVMTIVPDAAYSQILPKHFTYNQRLDYYFPQFAQLGMQPINYSELCPVQSHYEYSHGATEHLLTDTFGYQRPNHDLVWAPDTIHGQLRKSLRDIVINRVFAERPELGKDFIEIDADDTNRIFAVTEDDNDVVIGQIAVHMIGKRPIPRIVIPTLGR